MVGIGQTQGAKYWMGERHIEKNSGREKKVLKLPPAPQEAKRTSTDRNAERRDGNSKETPYGSYIGSKGQSLFS